MDKKTENIHPIFDRIINQKVREQKNGHKALTVWFTGLSGSGKSTIASALEKKLVKERVYAKVIDGDNTRSGLCSDLGFSLEERRENIRRVAELSKLFNQSGILTINTFVSPTKEIRAMAKTIIGDDSFIEIYIDSSLEVCEERDVKGLYAKARRGEIKNFTGINSPYEAPEFPDCWVKTDRLTVEESMNQIYTYIKARI